jgi:diguanylate cyclase (GGDEF)-like protein/PAS domain S-box-containing protein
VGGDSLKSVLLAEASPTRRRALAALLGQRGFNVTAPPSRGEALVFLRAARGRAMTLDAIVVGWPEHNDTLSEDLFGTLHGESFEHLPVLLLADSSNDAVVNWRMTRPRTSLLLWADYAESADAIDQMLRPQAQASTPMVGGGSLRVLFVDDSATVRHAFTKLIDKQGFVVETANSVAQGLKKALSMPFDIAIVDYFMPEANGTELISALRRDPATQHILSAMITGTYSDAVITESLASGAMECLFKSEAKELFLARLASLARTVVDRKAIDAERRRLEGILSSVGDGVYGVDGDGTIQFINPAAVDLLGYAGADELIGRNAAEVVHPAQEDGTPLPRSSSFLSQCYANGSQIPSWQTVFWSSTRTAVPVECTVYPLRVDGERTGSVVAFRDVSAQRQLEEQLRWQAEHDGLTKLYNRAWFENQLDQEISRLRRGGSTSLLLFVDLDRFKYINDTAGHSAGDQLLVEVSRRLKSRLRGSDHLARMGGDEYAIILRNVQSDDVEALADGFRRALTSAPFSYGGKTYRITISIGATRLDKHTLSPGEAMAQADIACHLSKTAGRNQTHIYTEESGRRAAMEADLGWSSRLEEALRGDRFELCFQPIIPLRGIERDALPDDGIEIWQRQMARNPECPALFEVLLRLRGTQGDLISPNAFIPTAERFGMMHDIDRWVIDHALRALRDTRGAERPVALTINLSAQSLSSDSLVSFITDKVVRYDVDPTMLIFEITESHSIEDIVSVKALLHELRQLGCQIAVDDFGTGFSTFAYLRQLEADYLKIDGSIIQGLPDDALDRTVVAALTSIAEIAGKRTIAEWVEDPKVLIALYECGVDYAQGYAVSHPRLQLALRIPGMAGDGDGQHAAVESDEALRRNGTAG